MPNDCPSIFVLFVLFLPSLNCNNYNEPLNFVPQQCTDIPIAFDSMASVRCLQLVPKDHQYGRPQSYKIQNYYIVRISKSCHDVVRLEASDNKLFTNVCDEVCVNEYTLLFNNLPNISLYNIFYSKDVGYSPVGLWTIMKGMSFDFLPFEDCGTGKRLDRILMIVVYTLCGVIGVVTVMVILKYILSYRIARQPDPQPLNWRWLFDYFCCRLQKAPPTKTSHISQIVTAEPVQPAANPYDQSSQSYPTSTQDIRNAETTSNGQSAVQSSSMTNTPALNDALRSTYVDLTSTTNTTASSVSFDEPVLQRLASKASHAVSTLSAGVENTALEAKLSSQSYYERF